MKLLFSVLLPTSWYERACIGIMGWEFEDKNRLRERYGPAIILVTAGMNQLLCADPAMTNVILARRKDFIQLPVGSKVMSFLGQNVLTVSLHLLAHRWSPLFFITTVTVYR